MGGRDKDFDWVETRLAEEIERLREGRTAMGAEQYQILDREFLIELTDVALAETKHLLLQMRNDAYAQRALRNVLGEEARREAKASGIQSDMLKRALHVAYWTLLAAVIGALAAIAGLFVE